MDATQQGRRLADLLSPDDCAACACTADDVRLLIEARGVAFDSRQVQPYDLYFAFAGRNHDGHAFAHQAAQRGAVAIICARPIVDLPVPQLVHPNPRELMGRMARALHHDPAAALRVVAITGTNGKTTTAHLVASMLAAAWGKAGLLGTLGASCVTWDDEGQGPIIAPYASGGGLTTPEAPELLALLARFVAAGVPAVVLEASSIALIEGRLSEVPCDVALLTNITQDHLDYHGAMDAYRAAKGRLFAQGRKPEGVSIWPQQLQQAHWMPQPNDGALLTYDPGDAWPPDEAADITLVTDDEASARAHGALLVRTPRGLLRLVSPLFGRFNDENVLAAVAVGEALQLPHEAMVRGIAQMAPVPGRLEPVVLPDGRARPLVLVDFAHTPDALARVLQAVRDRARGRVTVVVGCGGDRDRSKRPLMGRAAAAADAVWLTSDNPRSEEPKAIAQAMLSGLLEALAGAQEPCAWHVELDRAQAIKQAVHAARSDDIVLVAGKGHEGYQLIAGHTWPFDDRTQARIALRAWQPGGTPP